MARSYRHHKSRQKEKSKGGGGGNIWGLRKKFTTQPSKVHFARPETKYIDPETEEEVDYLMVTEHFVRSANGGKGGGIRCGPTCVVCAYTSPQEFDLDIDADPGMAKCRPRDNFVVGGWEEGAFHLVEETSKRDETKKYTVRKECKGQKCKYCRDDAPIVFGNRFYHAFSGSAWTNALFETHERAGQHCKCGGYVFATEYKCANPECETVLYDAMSECDKCGSTDIGLEVEDGEGDYQAGVYASCEGCNKKWALCVLDNESLADEVLGTVRCPECGTVDTPEPINECTEEGCECEPYDIFDCQLTIKKESTDQTASIVVTKMKIKEPDPRLFDPDHQSKDAEDAARDVEVMLTPIDLTNAYPERTTSEQAKILGLRDPFAPSKGSGVRRYQKDADEDED